MSYRVSSLPGQDAFGAIVTDLDPARIEDQSVRQSLFKLWLEAGVVVFRGLGEGRDVHVSLSRIFGPLVDHINSRETGSKDREVINIIWDGEQEIYEVDGQALGSWLPWHIDLIYAPEVNRGGMLRAVNLPAHGGGKTGFIDRAAAYDTVPADLKTRIEGRSVIYRASFDATTQRFGKTPNLKLLQESARLGALADKNFARVVHPMVFTHEESGRNILNISPWFSESIEGMGAEESDEILSAVVDHCVNTPKLAFFHDWEVGDLVLWDNWRMLHSCTGVVPSDMRLLTRTTIMGDYGLGRLLDASSDLGVASAVSV